jgi:hypothetical protein
VVSEHQYGLRAISSELLSRRKQRTQSLTSSEAWASRRLEASTVTTWHLLSQSVLRRERRTPGSSADSVVWADLSQRADQESGATLSKRTFL